MVWLGNFPLSQVSASPEYVAPENVVNKDLDKRKREIEDDEVSSRDRNDHMI